CGCGSALPERLDPKGDAAAGTIVRPGGRGVTAVPADEGDAWRVPLAVEQVRIKVDERPVLLRPGFADEDAEDGQSEDAQPHIVIVEIPRQRARVPGRVQDDADREGR